LRGGRLADQAARVIEEAEAGGIQLRTSSEVYDDAITAIRSDGYALKLALDFVSDMRSIPHTPLPMNAQVAADAMSLYLKLGGRSKLSYFDSFHVATARSVGMNLLTSDRYILANNRALGIGTSDLASWKR
jgi:predicted nucleic acid-binding protein